VRGRCDYFSENGTNTFSWEEKLVAPLIATPNVVDLEEPVRVASPTRINLEEPISSGYPAQTGLTWRNQFLLVTQPKQD
jgi:hypothetical protein